MMGARRGGSTDEGSASDPRGGGSQRAADERQLLPYVVSAVGVVVVAATVGEWAVLVALDRGVRSMQALVQAGLNVGPGVALAYAGVWVRRNLPAERHARLVGWCLGGLVASLAVNAALIATFPPDPVTLVVGWARTAAAFGAVAGVAVGIIEGRAIERSIEAERARIRADAAERRRDRLAYLNSFLRHEVLNAANVVTGYSGYMIERDDLDETTRERLSAVHRQGERLVDVVDDVHLLTEAIEDPDLEPLDLSEVVREEVRALRESHDAVTVRTDVPGEVMVPGDRLLGHAVGNLLDNAVRHNDGDDPEVRVTVERRGERVRIAVADNGPGVPPDEREAMFERKTAHNHGLGLYLVQTVARRYGGEAELADTGDDGSVFTVEFPTAAADDAPVDAPTEDTSTTTTSTPTDRSGTDERSSDRSGTDERSSRDDDGHPAVS